MRVSALVSRVILIAAAGLAMLAPTSASAENCDSTLVFGPSYVVGPAGYMHPVVAAGDTVAIYGTIAGLGGPLAGAAPYGSEVTWVLGPMVCDWTRSWHDFNYERSGVVSEFYNGLLSVYLDGTPDADISSSGSYGTGTLVLAGHVDRFYLATGTGPDQYVGILVLSGGAWLSHFEGLGPELSVNVYGQYSDMYPDVLPDGVLGIFHGRIKTPCAVPVRATTWGRLKAMYE